VDGRHDVDGAKTPSELSESIRSALLEDEDEASLPSRSRAHRLPDLSCVARRLPAAEDVAEGQPSTGRRMRRAQDLELASVEDVSRS